MHLADTINIIPDFCVFKKSDTSGLETMVAFIKFAGYRIAIAVHPVHRAVDLRHEKGVCQKKKKTNAPRRILVILPPGYFHIAVRRAQAIFVSY